MIKLIVLIIAFFSVRAVSQNIPPEPGQAGSVFPGKSAAGQSVSISSDGITAIAGCPFLNNGKGGIVIYNLSGNELIPSSVMAGSDCVNTSHIGCSVSISGDGNTAVAGGFSDDSRKGALWVFSRTGEFWAQQGKKLTAQDNTSGAGLGFSAAISADGKTIAAGGPFDNSSAGAVWIFILANWEWMQQGPKLTANRNMTGSLLGYSVAVSADGNTVIAGAPFFNSAQGCALIFIRRSGVWQQADEIIKGNGGSIYASQGFSVALSANCKTAAVGGINDNFSKGAVWIFSRDGDTWMQEGGKLTGNGSSAGAMQGCSVSLSGDGSILLSGAPGDNRERGAVWIFKRSGGKWAQSGSKFSGTDNISSGSMLGTSTALSADGHIFITGGPGHNSGQGNIWVDADTTLMIGKKIRDENLSKETKYGFVLYQNTPNPFNPSTTICYQIPEDCRVILKLYDMLGSEVAKITDTEQERGLHSVSLDLSRLASGIYIYRLQAGNYKAEKKLLLLK